MNVIHIKKAFKTTYSLHIDKNGDVVITTNKSFPSSRVDKVIAKHLDWINKRLEEYASFNKLSKDYSKKYIDGESFNILGETYYLKLIEGKNKRAKTRINNSFLEIIAKEIMNFSKDSIKKEVQAFCKKYFKNLCIDKSLYYAEKYNVKFNKVTVKNHKSKWGSCSSTKNLNFDWKLIFCPESVVDYVIIHEVSHLLQMNHSKRFWDLVKIECPDYKTQRKWLRENGKYIKLSL